MTPNTELKAHMAPLTRAELPPRLDDSRDWQENDVAIVGRGYVGFGTDQEGPR
jgi:hypothetical protein